MNQKTQCAIALSKGPKTALRVQRLVGAVVALVPEGLRVMLVPIQDWHDPSEVIKDLGKRGFTADPEHIFTCERSVYKALGGKLGCRYLETARPNVTYVSDDQLLKRPRRLSDAVVKRCFELRKKGLSFASVAHAIGHSPYGVRTCIMNSAHVESGLVSKEEFDACQKVKAKRAKDSWGKNWKRRGLGYTYCRQKQRYVVNPHEAPIVKFAFEARARGETMNSVRAQCVMNFPNHRIPVPGALLRILRMPRYVRIGLVSQKLFDAANEVFRPENGPGTMPKILVDLCAKEGIPSVKELEQARAEARLSAPATVQKILDTAYEVVKADKDLAALIDHEGPMTPEIRHRHNGFTHFSAKALALRTGVSERSINRVRSTLSKSGLKGLLKRYKDYL